MPDHPRQPLPAATLALIRKKAEELIDLTRPELEHEPEARALLIDAVDHRVSTFRLTEPHD